MRAAVVGASGYTGGELLRLLLGHPQATVVACGAQRRVGERVTSVHPGLIELAGMQFVDCATALATECDVVFLALPHGASGTLTLPPAVVVDLSADHRLRSASAWQEYYPSAPEWQPAWPYGLPELPGARAVLRTARRIANPGCYPTAVACALRPACDAGLITGGAVTVVAASGTSGAGRTASEDLLATEVMGAMRAYRAAGGHQHTPEMEQSLPGLTVLFTPMLAPMPRGILAVATAPLASGGSAAGGAQPIDQDEVERIYATAYADEPFIHLLPRGQWPTTSAVLGTNCVHLAVAVEQRTATLTCIAAIDNLGKGAAGQAVQNANIALGLPETAGLPRAAVSP